MKKFHKFSLSILGAVILSAQANAQVYEIVPGIIYPQGVSNNGIVSMVTYQPGQIVWWHKDNPDIDNSRGMVLIGTTDPTYSYAGQVTVSKDGKKIAATVNNPDTGYGEMGLYDMDSKTWSFKGGLVSSTTQYFLSSPYGISEGGDIMVGNARFTEQISHAVKWDAINGLVDLGSIVDGRYSRANAVNADGTVIVGSQDNTNGSRVAAKWVNGVESFILNAGGGNPGEANVVSSDGKTIAGYSANAPAWVWNETTGFKYIPQPDGYDFGVQSGATGISSDGKTIVGYFREPGTPAYSGQGFIYTPEDNTRKNLNDYVTSLGIDTQGITFALPLAISPDGTKIAGIGRKSGGVVDAFYIDLSNSSTMAVQNVNKTTLSIAPNPITNYFSLKGTQDISKISVYSADGKLMKTFSSSQDSYSVAELKSGLYIISVEENNGTKTSFRLIKK